MIINVGARTDIVNYYGEWLLNRFRAGYVYTRNPLFPDKVTRYELTPDKVDAVLFCSKNYAPMLPGIREISDRFRVYCHYTITAYGKDVEPNVPDIETSMETLARLSEIVGKRRVAWRYDPVLLTGGYTVERHLETFAYMAKRLAPLVDRCIFSFVEMYKKLERNFPELVPLTDADRERIAAGLGKIAGEYGIPIQTCGTDRDYAKYGIRSSGCATLAIIGAANGCEFKDIAHKGQRQGCHCVESRDVGAYDTCPNGCKYCYANKSMERVRENFKRHDKSSPLLVGRLEETDTLAQGVQTSFLKTDAAQQSLFDALDK